MRILEPKFEILQQPKLGLFGVFEMIKLAGQTCYDSESKRAPSDFVDMLIKSGHGAMLEHGTVYLDVPSEAIALKYEENPYSYVHKVHRLIKPFKNMYYVTTNYRVIVENGWEDDLQFITAPTEYHEKRVTVRFTTQIAISREYNRHRVDSIAEQSTRYCVSGDTLLTTKNPHYSLTIRGLYNMIKSSDNGSWKRIKIRNLEENSGELIYSNIKSVYYNGKKQLYLISTRLGYSLKCTKDHQIYTPNGWKRLEELSPGDIIYVNGKSSNSDILYQDRDWLYYQNITLNKTFTQISLEFGYNKSTLKKWARKFDLPKKGTGYFNIGREPWNKGLHDGDDPRVTKMVSALRKYNGGGTKDGDILKIDGKSYRKYNTGVCSICGCTLDTEVHHIDHNRENNDPGNLITLCPSCHKRVHSKNLDILATDIITDIKELGIKRVYDLEMVGDHNYVANGIIVHNCNYSKDKYNGQVSIVKPTWVDLSKHKGLEEVLAEGGTNQFFLNACQSIFNGYDQEEWSDILYWLFGNLAAEYTYLNLIRLGRSPQEARTVLALDTRTELVHTAFVSDWKHFFDLRALGTTGKPHPDAKVLAEPLMEEFKRLKLI